MARGEDITNSASPFVSIPRSEWVASNELAFAVRDRYPVTNGHTLIITHRVASTWFDATRDEQAAILSLVEEVKRGLDRELQPDGYNVGFNAGTAAGQTVMHLHVHVIPRYRGDMDDPRGGVRHVIPSKGNYLAHAKPLATGGASDPFVDHLRPLFATATEIAILAAFVQDSGLEEIDTDVERALARGARVRILTGDYLDITQASALEMLVGWQQTTKSGRLEARIVESQRIRRAFHPKSWRFEASTYGVAFVGSSNLSRSALLASATRTRATGTPAASSMPNGSPSMRREHAPRGSRCRQVSSRQSRCNPLHRRTRCSSRRSLRSRPCARRGATAGSSSWRPASARRSSQRSTGTSSGSSSDAHRGCSSWRIAKSCSGRRLARSGA
jgi:diadenosine tetraphosphate (Ap4A) HIT family hydrolase